ncbi:MAG: dihydroxyacetone kinase subunit DhaL [Christensenellales bacterium]|jgi:dihydroxyacetone kinase-like protein|nr:dihydroxyacetone kinase subunit L [Clostridiales bacterium]
MGSAQSLKKIIDAIGDAIIENKEYLTDLDRPIGDSDHGFNMAKGFSVVKQKLPDMDNESVENLLKTVAMALISTVGGASGPLYGTAFLQASKVMKGKDEIGREDVVAIFEEATQGVAKRGKSHQGEKTMLDALIPATETLKAEIAAGAPLAEAFEKAAQSALEGVEYTKTIIATKGRASYLGERSIGHQDPGATSSYIIIDTVAKALSGG